MDGNDDDLFMLLWLVATITFFALSFNGLANRQNEAENGKCPETAEQAEG